MIKVNKEITSSDLDKDFPDFCPLMENNYKDEIIKTSQELIDFVMEKYNIVNEDGFTCPIHKKLYKLLKKLDKNEL